MSSGHGGRLTRGCGSLRPREALYSVAADLYQLATDTNIMVSDALRVQPPAIAFIRTLGPVEAARWDSLVAAWADRRLTNETDTIAWKLTASSLLNPYTSR